MATIKEKAKQDLDIQEEHTANVIATYMEVLEKKEIKMAKLNEKIVELKDVLPKLQEEFKSKNLPVVLGRDLEENILIKDLSELKNILISGSTGTGKTIFCESVIYGLLKTKTPKELQLSLIDVKMVEYFQYDGLPHLLHPVTGDSKIACKELNSLVKEITLRKEEFRKSKSTSIEEHNKKEGFAKLPYILIIIDEFADLILNEVKEEFENSICDIAKNGSEGGIHAILTTSKPADSVFTEKIRDSFRTRIAFSLGTERDSQRVIEENGAEELMGNGDMIYKDLETNERKRLQGVYVDYYKDTEKLVKDLLKG